MRATYIEDGADLCISNAKVKQILIFVNDSPILNNTAFAHHSQPLFNYATLCSTCSKIKDYLLSIVF